MVTFLPVMGTGKVASRQGSPRRRLQHLRQVRVRPSLPSRPSFPRFPVASPSPDDRSPAPDSRSYIRRQETQERVIGTLLGTVSPDGVVEVKNSYAVPHNEQDDTVFVDVEFHRAMIDLHQKVNPGEKIVGWYSTGDGIVPTDALIHEFYAHECVDPVHVTLDVNFVDRSKLVRAWVGHPVVLAASAADAKAAAKEAVAAPATPEKDENTGSRSASEATERPAAAPPAATHFQEIALANEFDAAERVGTSLLANPATDSIASEAEGLEKTVRKLGEMLEKTAAYVDGVVEGKVPADAEIGRRLADALAAVPRLTKDQFEKVFGDAIQDVLLVMYLSNITKMQLMLAEKLQTASLLV